MPPVEFYFPGRDQYSKEFVGRASKVQTNYSLASRIGVGDAGTDGLERTTEACGGMVMGNYGWPTTAEISEVFAGEISRLGGTVTDRYDDGNCLLARSVLPGLREVGRNDAVQGGVAIRSTDEAIQIHPYVFRQICSNGAIMAQAIQTWQIERVDSLGVVKPSPFAEIREAIQACGSDEAFSDSANRMRSTRETQADLALMVISMMNRLPQEIVAQTLRLITDRFVEGTDTSRFGLMNAVTSVARDTRDPGLRWKLEELGGGVPYDVARPMPTLGPVRAEMVLV